MHPLIRTLSQSEMENFWVIHKFGGTSVGNAKCMRKCCEIIKPLTRKSKVAVVVSAMGGKPKVTDLLLDSVYAASKGDCNNSRFLLNNILDKHQECVDELLKDAPEIRNSIMSKLRSDLNDINDLLKAVSLMRMAHSQILELVSGYGEVTTDIFYIVFKECLTNKCA